MPSSATAYAHSAGLGRTWLETDVIVMLLEAMLKDDWAWSGRGGESCPFFTRLVTFTAVSDVTEAVYMDEEGTASGLDVLSTRRLLFRRLVMVLVMEKCYPWKG